MPVVCLYDALCPSLCVSGERLLNKVSNNKWKAFTPVNILHIGVTEEISFGFGYYWTDTICPVWRSDFCSPKGHEGRPEALMPSEISAFSLYLSIPMSTLFFESYLIWPSLHLSFCLSVSLSHSLTRSLSKWLAPSSVPAVRGCGVWAGGRRPLLALNEPRCRASRPGAEIHNRQRGMTGGSNFQTFVPDGWRAIRHGGGACFLNLGTAWASHPASTEQGDTLMPRK